MLNDDERRLQAELDETQLVALLTELVRRPSAVIAKHGIVKESRIGYSVGCNYPPDWGEHTVSLRPGDKPSPSASARSRQRRRCRRRRFRHWPAVGYGADRARAAAVATLFRRLARFIQFRGQHFEFRRRVLLE
jgi:class 3 adenylate cyclase